MDEIEEIKKLIRDLDLEPAGLESQKDLNELLKKK